MWQFKFSRSSKHTNFNMQLCHVAATCKQMQQMTKSNMQNYCMQSSLKNLTIYITYILIALFTKYI